MFILKNYDRGIFCLLTNSSNQKCLLKIYCVPVTILKVQSTVMKKENVYLYSKYNEQN